jgi:HTH-type transcriptional regulator/antitoxin HigA
MIMNERQYRITSAAAERFRQALAAPGKPVAGLHPTLRKLSRQAMESKLAELEEEIKAYDALKSGRPKLTGTLNDIGGLLVHARTARGWSQQELGDRVGVAMQQIQRYEKTLYESASLSRVQEVAQALGVISDVRLKLVELLTSLDHKKAAIAAR